MTRWSSNNIRSQNKRRVLRKRTWWFVPTALTLQIPLSRRFRDDFDGRLIVKSSVYLDAFNLKSEFGEYSLPVDNIKPFGMWASWRMLKNFTREGNASFVEGENRRDLFRRFFGIVIWCCWNKSHDKTLKQGLKVVVKLDRIIKEYPVLTNLFDLNDWKNDCRSRKRRLFRRGRLDRRHWRIRFLSVFIFRLRVRVVYPRRDVEKWLLVGDSRHAMRSYSRLAAKTSFHSNNMI